MTSTTNDIYEILVKKSKITDNYATLTHDQLNNTLMIPCNDLYNFYNDSLFYLHLYNSLYLEVMYQNQQDNFDIEIFKKGVDGLTIIIDNTTNSSKMGNLSKGSGGSYIFTFYILSFTSNYNNVDKYPQSQLSAVATNDFLVNVDDNRTTPSGTNGRVKITLNAITGGVTTSVVSGGSNYSSTPGDTTIKSPIVGGTFNLTVTNGVVTAISPPTASVSSRSILVPQIENIYTTGIPAINTEMIDVNAGNNYNYSDADKQKLIIGLSTKYPSYTLDARKQKFRRVMNEILNTPPENFLSYLFYNRVYYNVIVNNASIQSIIRDKYLNNNGINMNDTASFNSNSSLSTITTYIYNMGLNLLRLKLSSDYTTNDFIVDKSKYADKILLLNNTRDEYYQVETALNRVIRDYNQYLANYQQIKIYASIIIIFIVLLLISLVAITILPFSYNSKNTYYIVILIVLIILLAIYYSNFSHVGLYETFDCNFNNQYNPTHKDIQTRNNHKTNNYNFFNTISDYLNNYNNAYSDLNDSLSASVFIGNNKTYADDANTYLYRLYVDKKRRTELNRMKKISLNNHIEAMKKQIVYLFNIIILISFLAIILVVSLIIYTSAPFYINYIITFAIIAIIAAVVFFIYSIVQPTRMKANKNYWADQNPNNETINNL